MSKRYFNIDRFLPSYGQPVGVNLAGGTRSGQLGITSACMQLRSGDSVAGDVFSIVPKGDGTDTEETDAVVHASPLSRSVQLLKVHMDCEVADASAANDAATVELELAKGVNVGTEEVPRWNYTPFYHIQLGTFKGGDRLSYDIDPRFLPTVVMERNTALVAAVRAVRGIGSEPIDFVQINCEMVYTFMNLDVNPGF